MHDARVTVCFPFVGDTVGGSHLSALLLISGLDAARWAPVIVVHEEGPLAAHLRRRGVGYRPLPLPVYAGRESGAFAQAGALARCFAPLHRFVREAGAGIVHTHDGRMHASWALPARAAGARLVWHQRTAFAASRLARSALRLAHGVVCNSEWTARSLPARARGRASVIANPVRAEAAAAAARRCRGEILAGAGLAEAAVVGLVGSLRAVKRPMAFVDAAAALSRRLSRPAVFAVIGEDRERWAPRMRARADEAGIGGRLVFTGFRDPVEPWIAALDVLLAPSAGDAFGRTLVEAMQLGVPVVASEAGGHGEVVRGGETGLLVPAGDPGAMADAAARVLSDPEFASSLVRRARTEARARFGVEAHAAAVGEIYERLLAGRAPAIAGAPRTTEVRQ